MRTKILRMQTIAALTMAACTEQEDLAVRPTVVLSGDVSPISDGSVLSLDGTYTSCVERSGTWSVRVAANAPLTNTELSVISGDASCVLAITSINADQAYATNAPVALSATYQMAPSSFAPVSGNGVSFYANAKLNSAGFGADFVIAVVHSGDPSQVDAGAVSATYATVQSSNQATVVSAPNYTISFTTGTPFTLQLDAAKTVLSASGAATLLDGSTTGTTYVVDLGTLATNPSYLAVQAAFLLQTAHAISGANPTIPAAHFGLAGVSLVNPVVRTVMVGRLIGGVLGYELIKVTFRSP